MFKLRIAAGLVLITFVFLLIIALEFTIRSIFKQYDPRGVVEFYKANNDSSLYFGKPNAKIRQFSPSGEFDVEVKFNQYGYRSTKDTRAAAPDDLIFVGDSFTFGHGVDVKDRFSTRVENLLNVRTYNIGIPHNFDGYEAHLDYIKSFGVKSGKVILSVCMENDLYLYKNDRSIKRNTLESFGGDSFFQSTKWFFTKNSALYRLSVDIIKNIVATRINGIDTKNLSPSLRDQILTSSADKLLEIHQKHNLFLIVLIPSRAVYYGGTSEVALHDKFAELLRERGLRVLDLKPYMMSLEDPLKVHYKIDGHWNPKGHDFAAVRIATYLQENLLVSKKR